MTKEDKEIVNRILKASEGVDPYYMQLAYTERKLREPNSINAKRIEELEKKIHKIENNDLKHVPTPEEVYRLSFRLSQMEEKLNSFLGSGS